MGIRSPPVPPSTEEGGQPSKPNGVIEGDARGWRGIPPTSAVPLLTWEMILAAGAYQTAEIPNFQVGRLCAGQQQQ